MTVTMNRLAVLIAASLAAGLVGAQTVTVPNQFQAGQPARASDINANFEALRQAANRGFGKFFTESVTAKSDLTTSVVTVSCPAGTLLLGVSCSCDYASGTRNLGVLFACESSGNGGIVGCFSQNYNFNLPSPEGNVSVVCGGAQTVDGTRIPVTSTGVGTGQLSAKSAANAAAVESRIRQQEAEQRRALGLGR